MLDRVQWHKTVGNKPLVLHAITTNYRQSNSTRPKNLSDWGTRPAKSLKDLRWEGGGEEGGSTTSLQHTDAQTPDVG